MKELLAQRNVDLGWRYKVAEPGLPLIHFGVGGLVEDLETTFCEDDGGDDVFVVDGDGSIRVICQEEGQRWGVDAAAVRMSRGLKRPVDGDFRQLFTILLFCILCRVGRQ